VLVSPDGRDVYVGGYNDAAVAHFARDGATGGLTFVSAIFDGQAGADGLEGAGGLAMAMDGQGRHLYVPSSNESTLTVFERDPVTGALTWVQTLRDGGGVVSTLGFAFSALLSPDDALLYLTAATDGALTSFVRDPEFGVLDVLEAEIDGVGGVTGLAGARGLARSADGRRVYVAAQTSDAVAAFDFDPEFGATTQSGAVASGACAATLDFPAHVAVAGRFVYAPYLMSDAVLVLAPEPLAAWSALAAFAALAARSRSRVRARPKACR
jgi:6-phosphogluconolactonase (cycloisomerase 2 family)